MLRWLREATVEEDGAVSCLPVSSRDLATLIFGAQGGAVKKIPEGESCRHLFDMFGQKRGDEACARVVFCAMTSSIPWTPSYKRVRTLSFKAESPLFTGSRRKVSARTKANVRAIWF